MDEGGGVEGTVLRTLQSTHLLIIFTHAVPGRSDLAKHFGVGKRRVVLAELSAHAVLELEVGRRGTLGRVGILLLPLLPGLLLVVTVGRLQRGAKEAAVSQRVVPSLF